MAGRLWYIIFTSRTPKESVSSGDEDITGEPREQPERYFYERLVKLTRTKVAVSRRKGRNQRSTDARWLASIFFSFSFFLPFLLFSLLQPNNALARAIFQFSRVANRSAYQIQFADSIRRYVIFRSFFILITRFPITPPRGELNLRRFISRDQYLIESPRIESRRWRKKDTSSRQIVENDGYLLLTFWLRIRNERKRGFTITRKERRKLATSKKRFSSTGQNLRIFAEKFASSSY